MEAGLSSPEVRRHLQAEAQHHVIPNIACSHLCDSWMEAGLSSPEVRRHLQAEAQHHRRVLRESGVSAAARELLEEMRCNQEESCAQVRPQDEGSMRSGAVRGCGGISYTGTGILIRLCGFRPDQGRRLLHS